jgi:hypothetical protein
VLNALLKGLIVQVERAFFQVGPVVFIEKPLSSRCVATGKVQIRHKEKA